MNIKTLILIILLISIKNLRGQSYPLINDSISFCQLCSNDFVIDKIWKFDNEIYTKIKIDEIEYEFFKINDSTFHQRKIRNERIIEKGEILIKEENTIFKDTLICFDCNVEQPWEETIRIRSFIKPTKTGKWEINKNLNSRKVGFYDSNGNKINKWRFEKSDSIIVHDFKNDYWHFIHPNDKIIRNNKKWLFRHFNLYENGLRNNNLNGVLEAITRNHKIKLIPSEKTKHPANLKFSFINEKNITISILENGENIKSFDLNWSMDKKGDISIKKSNEILKTFRIYEFGEEFISLKTINNVNDY